MTDPDEDEPTTPPVTQPATSDGDPANDTEARYGDDESPA
jgi:hypothetical protein